MQPCLLGARGKALWAGLRAGPFSVSPEKLHCSYSFSFVHRGPRGRQGGRGACAALSAGRALGQRGALLVLLLSCAQGTQGRQGPGEKPLEN